MAATITFSSFEPAGRPCTVQRGTSSLVAKLRGTPSNV